MGIRLEHETRTLFKDYRKNIDYLNDRLGAGISFDLIRLEVNYADKDMTFYALDGFVKDDILQNVMSFLAGLKSEDLQPDPLKRLMERDIPYIQLGETADLNEASEKVLSGATILLVDGADRIIVVDARTYPARSPAEPDLERVVRGPREGYVESLNFNTALTRRRVRSPTLRMENIQVGRRSKTDTCVCYIGDIADPEKVKQVKEMLQGIDTDGLPMAEKTIEDFMSSSFANPYPVIRYTERPDTAAAHLFEGHILIMIDGSPSVMITSSTFWHHLQHAEEYRQRPMIGTYLRAVRFLAVLLSVLALPLYYLLSIQPELLPSGLEFIGPKEEGVVPLLLQFLIAEIGLDMLRMAAIHTPSSLVTALGLVAAIMIGQIAVDVGWFTSEVVLYISVAAIGSYATPSYELGMANRLVRLFLLLLVSIFGTVGYMVGITFWILYLIQMKTFRIPYFWPFIPFSHKAFRDVLIRVPIPLKNRRPTILHPKDPDR